MRPLIESATGARGYPAAFDNLGTQDTTPFLTLEAALDFPLAHLGLDFAALRARNHRLLGAGLALLGERLPITLGPDSRLPMRTFSWGARGDAAEAQRLTDTLRDAGVEVAVVTLHGRLHVRVSVQAYVGIDDFARLRDALALELGAGRPRAEPAGMGPS